MESCEQNSVELQLNATPVIADCDRTKCQRFSRIVGYYRPLSQWNEGKQAEWSERKIFSQK